MGLVTRTTNVSDLPPLMGQENQEKHTYTVKYVWLSLVLYFFFQAGSFFGCFFGIRGPGGEWPHAWWAFSLLGNAFLFTYLHSFNTISKIVRHPDTVEYFNVWGRSVWNVPLEKYGSVGLYHGVCGNVVFVKTDAYYEELRQKHCWCRCCITKNCSYAIRELDQFRADHGLLSSNDTKQVQSKV